MSRVGWGQSVEIMFPARGPSSQALQEIARRAKERDTGARGLRSNVEEVMLDIQYELPDIEAKGKYVVTDAVVRGETPLFERKAPATDKKSA